MAKIQQASMLWGAGRKTVPGNAWDTVRKRFPIDIEPESPWYLNKPQTISHFSFIQPTRIKGLLSASAILGAEDTNLSKVKKVLGLMKITRNK